MTIIELVEGIGVAFMLVVFVLFMQFGLPAMIGIAHEAVLMKYEDWFK